MGLFSRFKKSTPTTDDDVRADDELTDDDELDAQDTDTEAADRADDDADVDDAETDAADSDDDLDEEEALLEKSAPFDRSEKGPFDISEEYPEHDRLDLGALKVPVVDGMQVRLDTDDDSQRVLAVTLIHDGGGIQLQAFATPRSEGLWNTVRGQLAESVTKQGGESTELHTSLGKELAIEVPAKTESGRPGKRAMRFAGIDGPRWFVRAVFSGKAVTDDEVRAELSALFRGVVVDRGEEAMAPRELIALTAPQVDQDETEEKDEDELNPFERGPEITEVR
ncbi:hypothetical protein ABH903_002725 [Brevibacterium epidermidis]|jgi:hypothetical protein|uniref:DUF3710 domain-containing protein n=1 Tax=Brevibacterium epidermidis TaxID=1698 RepID=A0A9D2ULA5_BREEP|nr:DUF3710 domain-containing protein [Brevibacterium epidermidis]HHX46217.1 DUF3710 domain-containing protein [Brevibacterium sp.]HJE76876.1 DUF3710 domain-containing protein [Brevibacterium epidermidis]